MVSAEMLGCIKGASERLCSVLSVPFSVSYAKLSLLYTENAPMKMDGPTHAKQIQESAMQKIVTCFPIESSHARLIEQAAGADFEVMVSNQAGIKIDIFQADIYCGHSYEILDWPSIVQQGKLKWIQSSAAGLDHCLVPSVIHSEIAVSSCSALFASQVTEQTLALLTGLLRSMPTFYQAQQKREYIRRPTDILADKTVGILGYGGNGQRIAKALSSLVPKILATDYFAEQLGDTQAAAWVDEIYLPQRTPTVLESSDILIVTLPLTAGNDHFIALKELSQLKPGAYLINVGRGSVVDTGALIEALQSGHLRGAGLDVVDPEPLPVDSPLWEMDNVIITPHVGAQSPCRIPDTVDLFCQNLQRYRDREFLINQIDKHLGFPAPEHRLPSVR